jgi:tRNA A-37 threonylcarbamoyl transferase component Bud32
VSESGWEAVVALVRRMHDAGVDHRDLNLGNLLLREQDGEEAAFVVDLDRARLHVASIGFAARQRALRRLERSYVKVCCGRAQESVRERLYASYAGANEALAARLERGRATGRLLIRLHALGWRR